MPKTRLVAGSLPTQLVGPHTDAVDYAVIVPDAGGGRDGSPLPLLLNLHGAGGSCEQLKLEHEAGVWDARFASGLLPPVVVAMISAEISMYLDYWDGSQRWETFLRTEFIPFVEREFGCGGSASRRMAMGVSMGGFGVLKHCFRQPQDWGAVAACEPAIDAAIDAADITMRSPKRANEADPANTPEQARQTQVPGKYGPGSEVAGFDAAFYRQNNPVAMARDSGDAIRSSGLKICLEVGDHDFLMLHDGCELLHRILWDEQIEHQYYLHHGVDHVGPGMDWRMDQLCQWLGRMYRDYLALTEEEWAATHGPATDDEVEWLNWAFEEGGEGPMRGTPVDMGGPRAGVAVRAAGQSPPVRAAFGEATDGPAELLGFRWRGSGGGKL